MLCIYFALFTNSLSGNWQNNWLRLSILKVQNKVEKTVWIIMEFVSSYMQFPWKSMLNLVFNILYKFKVLLLSSAIYLCIINIFYLEHGSNYVHIMTFRYIAYELFAMLAHATSKINNCEWWIISWSFVTGAP